MKKCLHAAESKNVSLSAKKAMAKVDKGNVKMGEYIETRHIVNNEISTEVGLELNVTKADVDLKKLLSIILKKRKLKEKLKEGEKLEVMFAGDGRSIRTEHHSVAFYIVIISEGDDCQQHTHVHQIGLYKCGEKYKDIKKFAWRIIKDMREISKDGIDGICINMRLGGDMKFLNVMVGLHRPGTRNKSTCFCCYCSETQRRRNRTDHRMNMDRFVNRKGKDLQNPSLFPCLSPISIIPDTLHLNLRITGCLLSNFMTELFGDKRDDEAIKLIEVGMQSVIRGFKFFVRAQKSTSKNAWDAKYGFTPLRGPAKLSLMRQFDKVIEVTHKDDLQRKQWLSKLWKQWADIYAVIAAKPPIDETQEARKKRAKELQMKIIEFKNWMNKPSKGVNGRPGHERGGYTAAQTSTCYIHILLNHIHEYIAEYGGLYYYNMQAVEFINNSDGRVLLTGVSGRKSIVLAEILLANLRRFFLEEDDKDNEKIRKKCDICDIDSFTSFGRLRQHYEQTHRMSKEEAASHPMG